MAKILNVRERVHQPFWDTLARTAGLASGNRRVESGAANFARRRRVESRSGAHSKVGHFADV